MQNLAGHWWVILIIVVLLFGAPKLPALARSMGQSLKIFKAEVKSNDDSDPSAQNSTTAQNTTAVPHTTATQTPVNDSVASPQSGDTGSKP